MAEARSHGRWRSYALWLLTALLVGYTMFQEDDDNSSTPPSQAVAEPRDDEGKLAIADVKPVQVTPGASVVVQVTGAEPEGSLRARVGKMEAEVLYRRGAQIVVRIPTETELGRAKLRVLQGERRSKSRDLRVAPVRRRKLVRNTVGGLALFILGLRHLGRGLRAYAGHRIREVLARLTQGSWRGVGLGVLVGGVSQSTTSAAGLLVSLLQARMLAVPAALAVMLGAHLGAAATVMILPLAATREALLIVAIGVVWIGFESNRRRVGLGKAVLGIGLLFYGLHLLRSGFQPLVADPEVLPYLRFLDVESPRGFLASAAAGAALCAVLQGPGPVFGLVLGLAESSGLIGVPEGLAILAGTGVGAALATLAVGWPFGAKGRRFGAAHVLTGLLMTLVMLAGVYGWAALADVLVPGDPTEFRYGKKLLLPRVGVHLAVGFVVAQVSAVAVAAAVAPWVDRAIVGRLRTSASSRTHDQGAVVGADSAVPARGLTEAFSSCRGALDFVLEVIQTGERKPAVLAEENLEAARKGAETTLRTTDASPAGRSLRGAALSCMQLQVGIEATLRAAERGLERDMTVEGSDRETIDALHELAVAGVSEVIGALGSGPDVDAEGARAREIRMNALEAAYRRRIVGESSSPDHSVSFSLYASDLVAAYEAVGNQVYRAAAALAEDPDDDF